jgi:MFS family permease
MCAAAHVILSRNRAHIHRKTSLTTSRSSPGGRGLLAIFGSTFLELVAIFMLQPWLLLQLKHAQVSSTVAGLFVACSWLGIFAMAPFASAVIQVLGQRKSLWLSGAIPALCALVFASTQNLAVWFVAYLVMGLAGGLRWVLAEALVAEFAPPESRGRYVGLFETMVGLTFVAGPALLVAVGTDSPWAIWSTVAVALAGLLWSMALPPIAAAHDQHTAVVGMQGVWRALLAHPIIMLAGFVGGFFESGVTSILPLYGLAIGLGAAAAALLVSASGLGSALVMLPAGMLADRFADPARGRHTMMVVFAGLTLLATCLVPLVAHMGWLVWPIVFLWGGAGGSLYTLAMIDIGAREQGITLVNSTAVLVLTYTLGGLLASASAGALIDWSPGAGFPGVLVAVAALGLWALLRSRKASALATSDAG